MIRVEVLFPEVANLYGDLENVDYLKKSCNQIEVVYDSLVDEPHFMTETPALIYLGSMSESAQLLVKEKLESYKEKLVEMIDDGVYFLFTGNALEVFGSDVIEKINGNDEVVFTGLNIYPTNARRDMLKRFNSLYLGEFDASSEVLTIVGFKSQFTHSFWLGTGKYTCVPDSGYMFKSLRGPGLNPDIIEEGIRLNNFMGTYIIGPILILNPPFTKWLLKELGAGDVILAFEEQAMEAYEKRVEEYSNEKTGFYY